MSFCHATKVASVLAGCGTVACLCGATWLKHSPELRYPVNPLGINRSPYGEVLAMAMQGPINSNFHAGVFGKRPEEILPKKESAKPGSLLLVRPQPEAKPTPQEIPAPSLLDRLQGMLASIGTGHVQRTNPLPASEELKFYLRRQTEEKLRFAYHLDPSHYANYNSLHFFLTEGMGTHKGLASTTAQLAKETIDYCLSQENDPRPALTASAACTNILHLMFKDHRNPSPIYSIAQMREVLKQLDVCLARYDQIAKTWDESGQWNLLSPQRVMDCQDRHDFIRNIRNAADATITRYEKDADQQINP